MGHLVSWSAVENLFTGVPADEPEPQPQPSDGAASPGQPFWARMSTEVTRRPVRVIGACLATVLAPAVVAHAGSLGAQATPVHQSAPVPAPAVGPPQTGDTGSWLAVARQAASSCPGLAPAVLVAVGQVETGLGVNVSTSTAGAVGPMQFMPSTWAVYGADGDGDGVADPHNPADALAGAARMLCANGGADAAGLPSALWNYNHSDDYVREVMTVARLVPTGPTAAGG